MPSNIIDTIPETNSSLSSEPLRNNFIAAKTEIEAIQTALVNSNITTVEPVEPLLNQLWLDETEDPVDTFIDDAAYNTNWNGNNTLAPSKNALYDKLIATDNKIKLLTLALAIPANVYVGATKTWPILNYESFRSYSVSASAGTISIVGSDISFIAPVTPQTVTVTIGVDGISREFSIEILVVPNSTIGTPGSLGFGLGSIFL